MHRHYYIRVANIDASPHIAVPHSCCLDLPFQSHPCPSPPTPVVITAIYCHRHYGRRRRCKRNRSARHCKCIPTFMWVHAATPRCPQKHDIRDAPCPACTGSDHQDQTCQSSNPHHRPNYPPASENVQLQRHRASDTEPEIQEFRNAVVVTPGNTERHHTTKLLLTKFNITPLVVWRL